MDDVNPILARKLGLTPSATPKPEDGAAALERQVRRALGRAADTALGLSATLEEVSEGDVEAEELIETGPEGWVVLGLRDGSGVGLSGLFLIDPPLRSALVEMQTMGSLLPQTGDQRRVTGVDAMMATPFANLFLKELAEVGFGGPDIDAAGYDMGPIDDLRTAGLVMMQGRYRRWKLNIKMGAGEAVGEILIAMRPPAVVVDVMPDNGADWSSALRDALNEAPAYLDAELSRISLPIAEVEGFEVGQLIPLAGTTVGSVTLIGPGGDVVTTARLGQAAGKRAVKIERARLEMRDDPPKRSVTSATIAAHGAADASSSMDDTSTLVQG